MKRSNGSAGGVAEAQQDVALTFGALQMKIVSQCREQAGRVYNLCRV